MNSDIILVILGEPNSTFSEVLFKYFSSINFKKNKNRIILIGNSKLLLKQMKKLNYNFNVNEIINVKDYLKKSINILNVDYSFSKPFAKISGSSNKYIESCFNLAIKLIKLNKINKLINGPISKTHFLKKNFQELQNTLVLKLIKNSKLCLYIIIIYQFVP